MSCVFQVACLDKKIADYSWCHQSSTLRKLQHCRTVSFYRSHYISITNHFNSDNACYLSSLYHYLCEGSQMVESRSPTIPTEGDYLAGEGSRTELFICSASTIWINSVSVIFCVNTSRRVSWYLISVCWHYYTLHKTPRKGFLAACFPHKQSLCDLAMKFPSLFNLLWIFEFVGQSHSHSTRDFKDN